MPTAREIARQQRQARRDRERDARKADRERLKQLRSHIKAAKRHGRTRMHEVVKLCRRGRAKARELGKAARARARAAALAEIDQLRDQSRRDCEARKDKARSQSADSLQRAAATYQAEHRHQSTVRRYSKPARLSGPQKRRIDAIAESDAEVLNNIPPELVPVWREVKGRIKGTPRRTRTESFLEWAAEHSADVLAIVDRALQRDVAQMIAEEKTLREYVGRPTHYGKLSDAELVSRYKRYHGAPEVPF